MRAPTRLPTAGRFFRQIFALLLALPAAAAPRLSASLDTTTVTLGQPFHLRLAVERDAGERTLFPAPGDEMGGFRVAGTTPMVTTDLPDGRQRDALDVELRTFALEPGPVPAVDVAVIGAGGDTLHLRSEALTLSVESVRDPEEGEELRGIKPPLAIPGGWPLWLVALLAALLAVAAAFLVRRFLARRQAPAAAAPAAPPPPPLDFEREFARIASMGLLERGATKQFYTCLSDVMRRFLQERLHVDALERTTSEIATHLGRKESLDDDLVRRILALLEAADLVKFARAEPSRDESRAWPEEGVGIVREVAERARQREEARARQEARAGEEARARQAASRPDAPVRRSGDGNDATTTRAGQD